MRIFRIAVAAALTVGFGSAALAQTQQIQPLPADFSALQDGRSVAVQDSAGVYRGAPVAPSASHTVMGLSTPY